MRREPFRGTGGVRAVSLGNGLQALDSYNTIAAYNGPGGPASLYLEHHMNANGNRLFAELIAKTLAETPPAR